MFRLNHINFYSWPDARYETLGEAIEGARVFGWETAIYQAFGDDWIQVGHWSPVSGYRSNLEK